MSKVLHAVLTLNFTPGLGPRKIKLLLEHFGAEALADATPTELLVVEGVGRKLAETIAASRDAART